MKYVWLISLLAWPALAQNPNKEIEFVLDGSVVKKEKIAVPDFELTADNVRFREAWRTINEVLRADLANSGYFTVLGQDRYRLIRSPHQGAIDFEEWGSIEAEHLVVGKISSNDGRLRVEVRLFEIASQQKIIAKAYSGSLDLARRVAHAIADDIMLHLRNATFATSRILYTKEDRREDGRVYKELFLMDYDGYNPLPVTRGGIAISPTATRVGDDLIVAYALFENAYTFNAQYSIFLKRGIAARPIRMMGSANQRTASPSISPDGRKLVFSTATEGNVDIYIANMDGSDMVRLTRHPAVDTNPSWSPGGRSLLFTSDRTGVPQIYRMDADGLNVERITYENPYNDSAVWNPRHNMMAYVSRFDNDFDIFIMDLETRKNYRITARQGSNEDPYWSPDGNQLCFTSNRTGTWQIYAINKDGSSFRQITNSGNNRDPVWIP